MMKLLRRAVVVRKIIAVDADIKNNLNILDECI